ncbi:hypothetical protein BDA99DRAFT_562020 [Phascolomyces articulosus]|uniref:Uncharacterized protein n=1 Tax=Phascolomyces articulosus TaxID=60185 RepID=A0AAD5PDG1_9FUNG|nr:hypothetical protein BDA99DRAFT_562020 [Phascolomyces articulosus]
MNRSKGVSLLAQGVASCSTQATAYGQCVASRYQDVHKDMCVKEFEAFKQCVQKVVSKEKMVVLR